MIITDVIEYVLKQSLLKGASSAEISVTYETGFSVTARERDVETLQYHNAKDIGIIVYKGQSSGSISLSDIRKTALDTAITAALRIADYTEPDPFSGIADPALLATTFPKIDLYYPWAITPREASDIATSCDSIGLDYDPRITRSEGASVGTYATESAYGNTNGFLGSYQTTYHSLSASFIAGENEAMQREHEYCAVRDATDLSSVQEIATKAAQKAIARLAPRTLKTQTARVLFNPETATSLIGHFLQAIRGRALYNKASFLFDSLGTMVFPKWFSIEELPHLNKGLGSAPYDNCGLATYQKFFVQDGVVENYILSLYSARRLNLQPTANSGGTHNLLVTSGTHNFQQMLQLLGTGLLVTEVMGSGVNMLTGDYSRGAAGFWVENGQIVYPVDGITIAGQLQDIYQNIIAVGNDAIKHRAIACPSILIERLMIGGV